MVLCISVKKSFVIWKNVKVQQYIWDEFYFGSTCQVKFVISKGVSNLGLFWLKTPTSLQGFVRALETSTVTHTVPLL